MEESLSFYGVSLVLIEFVLSSISVYFISLFKAHSIVLQVDVKDHRVWNLHLSSCYTVNNVYKNLSKVDDNNNQANY